VLFTENNLLFPATNRKKLLLLYSLLLVLRFANSVSVACFSGWSWVQSYSEFLSPTLLFINYTKISFARMFSKCSFAYIIAVEMITLEQWIPTNFAPRPIVATHYNRTNPKI